MKFFIADRQSGKTEKIIEWMIDAPEGEHRVCVSHSHQRAMRLLRECRERRLEVESWQFVGIEEIDKRTWSGVLAGRGGHIVLGIDDLDMSIRHLLVWPVGFVTATGEQVDG